MKKIISALLVLATVMCVFPVGLSAEAKSENVISKTTEYFNDGSYIEITVTEDEQMTRASTNVTGKKTYKYIDSVGATQWEFIIYGTFSVNVGVSATCTNCYYSYNIINSAWKNSSASARESGNQAIGDGTFTCSTGTRSCHVVLSCDKNGNFS